jgi:hypothetical protein
MDAPTFEVARRFKLNAVVREPDSLCNGVWHDCSNCRVPATKNSRSGSQRATGILKRQWSLRELEALARCDAGAWWMCGGHQLG